VNAPRRKSSARIGDLVADVGTWNPVRDGHGEFKYIDLSSVDQGCKTITEKPPIPCADAPSRARQLIESGDVLVSTVRPNLNGVARVPPQLHGATASTGFCVLRANERDLAGEYLFHWVKSPQFVNEMVRLATGASYPAVSDRIVLDSPIPLPPIAEQQRIAAILDNAEALRAKRKVADEVLLDLRESLYLELFRQNPTAPVIPLADVAENLRTGPFGSQLLHSEFVDSGIAVLGIDNAVQNEFLWARPRFITEKKFLELRRYQVLPGDVLITIMGTCGRCAIVPDDIPTAINTKHLCCITLNQSRCLPEYLQACLLLDPSVRDQFGVRERGAVMPGLNMQLIKDLAIPVPSIETQRRFVEQIRVLRSQTQKLRESTALCDSLFSSLQHEAFGGEL
jgi:type I restriction enzyme S subunit